MNETDLSDEALAIEAKAFKENACWQESPFEAGWQECRRRAQILLAEALAEKKRHDDMYEKEITSRDEEIENLSAEIEKERREAFAAAILRITDHPMREEWIEAEYSAFMQERKK